jgi:hypothetical protein
MARSNDLTIKVMAPPAPQLYDAAGATSVEVTIESPLAMGARVKVSRLTYEDHRARFPDDTGLKFADQIANKPLVFFTKKMLGG